MHSFIISSFRRASSTANVALDVAEGEQVVGFFGRSYWGEMFDGLVEFGILIAPKGAELPDAAYSMAELQNIDGGEDCALQVVSYTTKPVHLVEILNPPRQPRAMTKGTIGSYLVRDSTLAPRARVAMWMMSELPFVRDTCLMLLDAMSLSTVAQRAARLQKFALSLCFLFSLVMFLQYLVRVVFRFGGNRLLDRFSE